MRPDLTPLRPLALALFVASGITLAAQPPPGPGNRPDGPPPWDAPMPFQPGGFGGPGGPGGFGPNQPDLEIVARFDQNADGWLNAAERQAALAWLAEQGGARRGPGGRRGGFGPRGGEMVTPQPGAKLSPNDVPHYPDAPLYASNVIRTLFLEFENADWEKELEAFKNTDVDVPARLVMDGKVFADVGVHFRGASSFMMLGEGQKRSLTVTLDFIHKRQNLGGYRKLILLNSHGDPSFLRSVLSLEMARAYMPAPQANHVQVVVNGESWGLYVNQQHFNKDFLEENYSTSKGARWKVPGSPNGRGGLEYLGDDPAAYQRLYEIKTKDDPASWAALIRLCKVLNQTPAADLEAALAPVLDIDATLRFLAWDNVTANADGYWTRASDYSVFLAPDGRFHLIPYDANETFSLGGGPGGPGFGGPAGAAPTGGPAPDPALILAPQLLGQADRDQDGKVTRAEFVGLGETWFARLDPRRTGKVTEEDFFAGLARILPPPPGTGSPGRGPAGAGLRGGAEPVPFIGPMLFRAFDANHDGQFTATEMKATFGQWFTEWDRDRRGALDESALRAGLTTLLPAPAFDGLRLAPPGGQIGGQAGRGRGGGGGGRGVRGGPELDPLAVVNDESKPMLSKLLAVPELRERYLRYVREMAEQWLDWERLGPLAQQRHDLIAPVVRADTRKLASTADFERSLSDDGRASLKAFADRRRAYLLAHPQIKQLAP